MEKILLGACGVSKSSPVPPPPEGFFVAMITPEIYLSSSTTLVGFSTSFFGSLSPANGYTNVYAMSDGSTASCLVEGFDNSGIPVAGELRLLDGRSYTTQSPSSASEELFNFFYPIVGKKTPVYLKQIVF